VAARIPIKVKSAAALTVPLVMLFVVAGLEVTQASHQVRQVREQTELATSSIGPSGLVTALENERNYATMWMLGSETLVDLPVDSIEQSRRETDAAAAAFSDEVAEKGGDVERIYRPALDALRSLEEPRAVVDGFEGPRLIAESPQTEAQWQGYSTLIDALSDQNSQLSLEVADDELRQGVQLIDMASREIDRIARFVRLAVLSSVTGDGVLRDRDEILEISPLKDEAVRGHYATIELATGRYAELGDELQEESDATGAIPMANEIMETGMVDAPALLQAISIADDESYYGFVTDASEVIRARADELNAAARARQRGYVITAGLVLALAGTVAPLVSRSITRPLRSLTRQAKELADGRLPGAVRSVLETPRGDDVAIPALEPVTVDVGDEVGEVADTLNTMQSAALDLAVEQTVLRRNVADAFVSLARRNQNLLNRQLDYITELEANETDTGTIANLFRLDHHATRMRRNTESLLVLAGVEPARRWSAPVPLVNVVRAALGEVEDFQRVDIRRVLPATVLGPVVSDLAHLLAELIENALHFSPPSQTVQVQGRALADGYVLAIIDSGFGMGPADIAQANRRLAQAEAFTVAPSKYLGHYVAGTLAARHGIAVRLQSLPAGGLTAIVHLPPPVLTDDAAQPQALGGTPRVGRGDGGPGPGPGVPLEPVGPVGPSRPGLGAAGPAGPAQSPGTRRPGRGAREPAAPGPGPASARSSSPSGLGLGVASTAAPPPARTPEPTARAGPGAAWPPGRPTRGADGSWSPRPVASVPWADAPGGAGTSAHLLADFVAGVERGRREGRQGAGGDGREPARRT
jgi:signal transduction histidine kinase